MRTYPIFKIKDVFKQSIDCPKKGFCTTEIIPFYCFGEISHYYIASVLRSQYFIDYTTLCCYGCKMPRLSTDDARKGMIPLPPIAEQKRIVLTIKHLFLLIDSIDASKNDLQEAVNRCKTKVLDLAIHDKLESQDPNDEPASILLDRIRTEKKKLLKEGKLKKKDVVDSVIFKGEDNKYYEKVGGKTLEISEEIPFNIPGSWQWCRLGVVIRLQSGQDLTPDRYSDSESGIPYITGASNFVDNKISVTRWTTTPTAIAHHGDLLITCKGTVGAMAYNYSGGDYHIARQVMAINSFEINLEYIEKCIEFLLPVIEKEAHSIIPGISRETILQSIIPIPPLNEQLSIVNRIKDFCERL